MGRLSPQESAKRFDEFNEQRFRMYGYLGILSPQSVMDAQDKLMDYLIQVSHGTLTYEWENVRLLALNLLNEIRVDIGIDKAPITYKGDLKNSHTENTFVSRRVLIAKRLNDFLSG